MTMSVTLLPAAIGFAAMPILSEFDMRAPPGPHCPLTPEDVKAVKTYGADELIVGTHFFYWYDVHSKAHFVNHDGTDALVDHPVHTEDFSFKSVSWWKRELQDVTAAGIDFILPVYWGSPGYPKQWSFVGLPPLVKAWEELAAEGKKPPRVGLFYDTSTLKHNPPRRHVDLSTAAGKQWFYATIRDFFSLIPPKMWAAVERRPIIVLYSPGFAAKQDPDLFPFVRSEFRRDFSTDIYLVKSLGWQGEADSLSSWGGALGLKAYGVASLGPGYDHHAVPGRKPLVVDREGGAFYRRQWEQFLSYRLGRRAKIVLVETWNELHEGTDVCETKEYGRQYIELTAHYAKLFRSGVRLPKTGPFAKAQQVSWSASDPEGRNGIAVKSSGDGLMEPGTRDGRPYWRTRKNPHGGKYVYLALDDSFMFDEEDATVRLTVHYLDQGFSSFSVQYDSIDPRASVREGAFKAQGEEIRCQATGHWRQAALNVSGARFGNRCNGADIRLAVGGGDLAVAQLTVTRAH